MTNFLVQFFSYWMEMKFCEVRRNVMHGGAILVSYSVQRHLEQIGHMVNSCMI